MGKTKCKEYSRSASNRNYNTMDVKMKYTKKLNDMLLSDDDSYTLKLYSLRKLFKIAEFWNLSKTNQELLLNNKNIESIELYLDYLEYNTSRYLSKWKNLNTLEDFIELKELLKEMYFDNSINNLFKRDIINTISFFPTVEDYSFYLQVLNDIFIYRDEEVGIDIMLNCYSILRFIENNSFDLKMIQIANKTTKIFYGNMCLIGESETYMTRLKALKFIKERNLTFTFLDQYSINNRVETLMDDNAKSILNYKLLEDNDNIGIHFEINGNSIFEISQVNIVGLLNEFCILLGAYFDKNKNLALAENKFQIKEVKFDTKWKKKYNRYLTKIIKKKDRNMYTEIDTRDLLFTFSKMFAHLTFIYELKYSICLQHKTDISKKDYIKLITLSERAI